MTIGEIHRDGAGRLWRITAVHTSGWRSRLGPVTGERWNRKRYEVRNFELDGRFYDGSTSSMNLECHVKLDETR